MWGLNAAFLPFTSPSFPPMSTRISRPMSSTPPALMLPDTKSGNLFPFFEDEYAPWICPDMFPEPILQSEPVASSPASPDGQSPGPASHCTSDECKRRRMASNRESARRSRIRKQQYLENLRDEVNRLRIVNRELANQLQVTSHQTHLLRTENDQLLSQFTLLRRTLIEMKHIVRLRTLPRSSSNPTWPCANITTLAWEQLMAPLVTQEIWGEYKWREGSINIYIYISPYIYL